MHINSVNKSQWATIKLTSDLCLACFLELRPGDLHQPQGDGVLVGEALIGRIDDSVNLEHGNVPCPTCDRGGRNSTFKGSAEVH